MSHSDHIVILTPVKDAARHLNTYLKGLFSLSYPRHLLSVAFLESDSVDDTHELFAQRIGEFEATFRRVALYKKDFGYPSPTSHPRWASHLQLKRRTVLAKSRNHLLFRALDDEDWVLWLDEIETEGFGIMAHDLGVQCWGLPNLEIKHHPS